MESRPPHHENTTSLNGPGKDVEAGGAELKRDLQAHHLQFLAIGGTIGTGLFLGSGKAIATAGPVGCLIAFIFPGRDGLLHPVPGSFTVYASRFVDPSLGFAMGWIYWFNWSITFALELTAAGLIIQYWNAGLSIAIFITIFWLVFTAINFLPIRWYGEFEMWFSSIKVATIVGFVIFAICINAGAGDRGYIGFTNWVHPGPFAEFIVTGPTGKFMGFWSVLVTAGFSYQGAELVGVGAGETADPAKAVPLGPGVKVLPDIINAVLLTAVLSAANSNVYSGSRILVALANENHAPACIRRTNKIGTPYIAVGMTSAIGLLAYMNLSESGGNNLPYRAPLQPYLTYFGLFFCVLILLTNGFTAFINWSTSDFFAAYISLILFVVLFVGHKMIMRTKPVKLADVDLMAGRVEQ
ncbi:lysine permease [Apiospora arundinis]